MKFAVILNKLRMTHGYYSYINKFKYYQVQHFYLSSNA